MGKEQKFINKLKEAAEGLDGKLTHIVVEDKTNPEFREYFLKNEEGKLCKYICAYATIPVDGDYYDSELYPPKDDRVENMTFRLVTQKEFISLKKEDICREIGGEDMPLWKKVKTDASKLVYTEHSDAGLSLLLNIVSTDEDYYYMFMNTNLEIQFHTCVGTYYLPITTQEECLKNIEGTPLHSVLRCGDEGRMLLADLAHIYLQDVIDVPLGPYHRDGEILVDGVKIGERLKERYGDGWWFIEGLYEKRRKEILVLCKGS